MGNGKLDEKEKVNVNLYYKEAAEKVIKYLKNLDRRPEMMEDILYIKFSDALENIAGIEKKKENLTDIIAVLLSEAEEEYVDRILENME